MKSLRKMEKRNINSKKGGPPACAQARTTSTTAAAEGARPCARSCCTAPRRFRRPPSCSSPQQPHEASVQAGKSAAAPDDSLMQDVLTGGKRLCQKKVYSLICPVGKGGVVVCKQALCNEHQKRVQQGDDKAQLLTHAPHAGKKGSPNNHPRTRKPFCVQLEFAGGAVKLCMTHDSQIIILCSLPIFLSIFDSRR